MIEIARTVNVALAAVSAAVSAPAQIAAVAAAAAIVAKGKVAPNRR